MKRIAKDREKGWNVRDMKLLIEELSKGSELTKISKKMNREVAFLEAKIENCAPRFKENLNEALQNGRKKRLQREEYIGKSNMTLRKRKRKDVEEPRKRRKKQRRKVEMTAASSRPKRARKNKNDKISQKFETPGKKETSLKKQIVKKVKKNKAVKLESKKEKVSVQKRKIKIEKEEDQESMVKKIEEKKGTDEESVLFKTCSVKSETDIHHMRPVKKTKSKQITNTIKKSRSRGHFKRGDLGSQSNNVIKKVKGITNSSTPTKSATDASRIQRSSQNSDKENEPSSSDPILKLAPKKVEASIGSNLKNMLLKGKQSMIDPFGTVQRQRRTFSRKRQRQRLLSPPTPKKAKPKPKVSEDVSDDSSQGSESTAKSLSPQSKRKASPPKKVKKCIVQPKEPTKIAVKTPVKNDKHHFEVSQGSESRAKSLSPQTKRKASPPKKKVKKCVVQPKEPTKIAVKTPVKNDKYHFEISEDESGESYCLAEYDSDYETSFTRNDEPDLEEEQVEENETSDDEGERCTWRLYQCYLPKNFFFQRYLDHNWSIPREFTEDPFAESESE